MIISDPATYAFLLASTTVAPRTIPIGRLGELELHPGVYLYCGSARGPGGLRARIRHHLNIAPRSHWHLDYLRPHLEPLDLWWTVGDQSLECLWAHAVTYLPGAVVPLSRFGASDCSCLSHLHHFPPDQKPSFRGFTRRIHAAHRRHAPLHQCSLLRVAVASVQS